MVFVTVIVGHWNWVTVIHNKETLLIFSPQNKYMCTAILELAFSMDEEVLLVALVLSSRLYNLILLV